MIKKYHKVIIWTLFFVQMILIAVVLLTAKVDDVTLAKGDVQPFNTGWVLVREDGTQTNLEELPYNTVSTKTPVIALTANAIVGAKEKYLEDGFADYLSKPIREDELMQQLRKYLPDEMIETEKLTEQEQDIVDEESVQKAPPAVEAEEEPAASGTQTIEERFPYLNTNAGMTYCMKDESFYLEMIESYVQEDKRELLEKEFAAASWENYQVYMHALKSTSLTIGADHMSEQAKTIELAVKSADFAYVQEHHAEVMKEYEKLLEQLDRDLKSGYD